MVQGTRTSLPVAAAIVGLALVEAVSRFFSRQILTGASRWVEYDLRNR
jgi:uncharacterized membrane protein YjjP (DUF1212 family)